MIDFLFYLFAALTLLSALKVVLSRDAISAALSLIVCLIGVAALFVLLEAFFLAALQVLVYAGAVVVLFLFVIMLLDDKSEEDSTKGKSFSYSRSVTLSMSLIALFLLGTGIYLFFGPEGMHENTYPSTETQAVAALSKNFGRVLFTKYVLPFQIAGFLLLMTVIGVLLLSKNYSSEKKS